MTNRLYIAAAIFAALPVLTATAQEGGKRPVLEEIVVTAQMREQRLQDVPVSVSTVSGDKMLDAGIEKLEDMQAYVPNLVMSETGISTHIYIRGIGSGINPGFEQSVGMYFDGVYYGRSQLTRAPFLDLTRVEVLRGPQNILLGKNSIAGAISLHSARPKDYFEGRASALYEPDHGERIADVMLSGPLGERLGARLAVRHREMDGYMRNLTLDRDEPQREETTVRLLFDWAATDRLNALFKLEFGRFDVVGRQVEVITDQPSVSTNPLFAGRRYSEILHDTQVPDDQPVGNGAVLNIQSDPSVLNTTQDYRRSSNGDFSNNDTRNLTMHFDYALGEHQLTFITGLMHYEFDEVHDVSYTGADLLDGVLAEEYLQFSQELRWLSPVGGTFEYIGGAYFQHSELDYGDVVRIDSDILPDLLNLADGANGGDLGDRPVDGDVQGPCAGACDAGDHLRGLRIPRAFTTDTDLLSVFFQGTWNITSRFRTTVGLRVTREVKKGSRRVTFFNDGTGQPPEELDTVMAKNLNHEKHDLAGERTTNDLSPSLNVQFDLDEDLMLFATVSRGFKSGGFDARSNQSPVLKDPAPHNPNYGNVRAEQFEGTFEYDEEVATSFEAGAKGAFLHGAAELGITAFYTEYTDLQVSIFDGSVGFNVGNAAAAETMGVELDGRWALTETLTLIASAAWLDFEFTDFENGKCFQGEPDPDGDGICDRSGRTNQYVSRTSGNVTLAYRRPVWDDYELGFDTDVEFRSSYHPTQDLDPRVKQDGYYRVNARLELSAGERGWEVALLGKNLTDEPVISYANSMALSFSIFGSVGHYAFVEPPRSVALQVGYRW